MTWRAHATTLHTHWKCAVSRSTPWRSAVRASSWCRNCGRGNSGGGGGTGHSCYSRVCEPAHVLFAKHRGVWETPPPSRVCACAMAIAMEAVDPLA